MSRFVQLHLLTNYPPSNLNRDDTGRPKTALVGDAMRLRISSQSQKRAWRKSDEFHIALGASAPDSKEIVVEWDAKPNPKLGTRTKEGGIRIYKALVSRGMDDESARNWAQSIAEKFGALKKARKEKPLQELEIEQLAHFSPEERAAIDSLVKVCAERKTAPTSDELNLLSKPQSAVDIAMFGRMLASSPAYNMEAAVQVAHAITVHKTAVEDDYFSAVDDLNKGLEDKGAGHIGERGYGAGLFYLYICVNRELLKENLGGNEALTGRAMEALIHAVTKVSPTGMQNSHASRAYASYVLAEKGDQQPRSLAQAFLKPVKPFDGEDMFLKSVKAITTRWENFDKVYGACADARYEINVEKGEGSLEELITFVRV